MRVLACDHQRLSRSMGSLRNKGKHVKLPASPGNRASLLKSALGLAIRAFLCEGRSWCDFFPWCDMLARSRRPGEHRADDVGLAAIE